MANQIVPGPCPDCCPPPTEIDCISVDKIYDFCFTTLSQNNLCFPIPTTCGVIPLGSTATATVSSAFCDIIASTPILNPQGLLTGFVNATVLVNATVTITIAGPTGVVVCTFTGTTTFIETFTLCAPSGTTVTCTVVSSAVCPAAIVGTQVCTSVSICLLVQATASVQLLVPSYGFCTPAPCVVSPCPPVSCPPVPPAPCVVM